VGEGRWHAHARVRALVRRRWLRLTDGSMTGGRPEGRGVGPMVQESWHCT
jgi:hypothetical protein